MAVELRDRRNLVPGFEGLSRGAGFLLRKDVAEGQAKLQHDGHGVEVGRFASLAEAETAVIAERLELFTHNDLDRVRPEDAEAALDEDLIRWAIEPYTPIQPGGMERARPPGHPVVQALVLGTFTLRTTLRPSSSLTRTDLRSAPRRTSSSWPSTAGRQPAHRGIPVFTLVPGVAVGDMQPGVQHLVHHDVGNDVLSAGNDARRYHGERRRCRRE